MELQKIFHITKRRYFSTWTHPYSWKSEVTPNDAGLLLWSVGRVVLLFPHPQGTPFNLSYRIRTRQHGSGVTSLHSLPPLGTLMVSAAEVTYSSGCKDTAVSTNSSIFNRFNRRPVKVPVGENLGENGHLRPGFCRCFCVPSSKSAK